VDYRGHEHETRDRRDRIPALIRHARTGKDEEASGKQEHKAGIQAVKYEIRQIVSPTAPSAQARIEPHRERDQRPEEVGRSVRPDRERSAGRDLADEIEIIRDEIAADEGSNRKMDKAVIVQKARRVPIRYDSVRLQFTEGWLYWMGIEPQRHRDLVRNGRGFLSGDCNIPQRQCRRS